VSIDSLTSACATASSGLLLVVTGAGVSLASGIPTFRGADPGAVWSVDVTELGTVDYFRRDPIGSWQWYLRRFGSLHAARPNPAHFALATLERWQLARGGEFLLVTQNVDGLHEQAGSRELVHVHGRADRVRCSQLGCRHAQPKGWLPRDRGREAAFLREPTAATLPRCPACDAPLRQHVLWFDESYTGHRDYEIDRVLRAAKRAAVVLFVGTSFAVGVTELILERALSRGAKLFALDPVARDPHPAVVPVVATAEDGLPALCRALGAG
jgi:NAD-dependent deacetylase